MDQEAGALSGAEKRALQAAVGAAALVPVTVGWAGIIGGSHFLRLFGPAAALTHAAYLSGLLLGIGLGFWSTIPDIEKQGRIFSLLAGVVVLGGLARAEAALSLGAASPFIAGPLLMELGVTPLLWLWQRDLSRRMGQ
jgi:hypothetical protein